MRILPSACSFAIMILFLNLAPPIDAKERAKPAVQVAATFQLPQLPGLGGPAADWRQWDFFHLYREAVRPLMNKALSVLPQQTAGRYQSFIGAADKLAALGQQGAQLGLLQLSPDALRGMARMVAPGGGGDPIAYSLNVDNALRHIPLMLTCRFRPRPASLLLFGVRTTWYWAAAPKAELIKRRARKSIIVHR